MKCPKCHLENTADSAFCRKCGTRYDSTDQASFTKTLETTTGELARGTLFAGRYEVIEELGTGGMGKVYRVFDNRIKEEVALKLLRPEIASRQRTVERFRNEIRLARKIVHKNVCRMFDMGEERGTQFITMEYVAGEDLKSFIRRVGRLPVGKAVIIGRQIAAGLAEAHKIGVVHRDLKPGNIMIDKDGDARIMDFGIARSLAGGGTTAEGEVIGTPEYMSPEQVEGKETDQRTDIYALGAILFEMVTGRVPFEGATPFSIANKHKTEPAPDATTLNPQVPPDMSRIILRCMEKLPEERYQTTGELLADLETVSSARPTTERATSQVPSRTKPRTSRQITVTFGAKKLSIPLVGAFVLVLAGLAVWRFLPKKPVVPSSGRPSLAILYFKNISGDKSLDPWETGLTILLISKLRQSRFIDVIDENTIFGILKKLNLAEAKTYSKDDLVKVANEGGATHTISGTIIKAGQNIVLALTVQKPMAGEVLSSISADCNGEQEIMSKVDEVSNKIKSDLKMTTGQIAADISKEAGKITTSSPEAFKLFATARAALSSFDPEAAIPLLEKAVALDPGFANAYRSLGAAEAQRAHAEKSRMYYRKAFELRDRVSERERYLIEGSYYSSSEKNWDKAIGALTKLIELYPNDRLGNYNLGNQYSWIEEHDRAIELYEVGRKILRDPGFLSWDAIAAEYEAKGLYDKAKEVLEDYAQNFPDSAPLRIAFSQLYICQAKYDLALDEANKAWSLAPTGRDAILLMGIICLLQGDLNKAEKVFQNYLERSTIDAVSFGKVHLAYLYLSEGKFGKTKEQIRQVIELDRQAKAVTWETGDLEALGELFMKTGDFPQALKEYENAWGRAVEVDSLNWQRILLWKKGLAYIGLNSIENAQKTADELKEMIEKGIYKKVIRLYHHLQGSIELEKKNYPLAIEYLRKAVSSLPAESPRKTNAIYYDALALAFFKSGDLENAHKAYETVVSLTWSRVWDGDIYAKGLYHLGFIDEKLGDKAKARENYRKFLDLWKDADPGLPEVPDAKVRLAALRENGAQF